MRTRVNLQTPDPINGMLLAECGLGERWPARPEGIRNQCRRRPLTLHSTPCDPDSPLKVFHCDHCGAPVFFENVQCVNCGNALAFLPDLGFIGSLQQQGAGTWRSPLQQAAGRIYRLCSTTPTTMYVTGHWRRTTRTRCAFRRLTTVIPDIDPACAAQQLVQAGSLPNAVSSTACSSLGLPVRPKSDDPDHGLAFEILTPNYARDAEPVLTGHDNGLITIRCGRG